MQIDHIQLTAPPDSEPALRRFYGELLGLREIPKSAALADTGGVWFDLDGVGLHFGIEEAVMPASKRHVAFRVSNFDALKARLDAAGILIMEGKPLPGVERFFALDPFGNRLEFQKG